MYENRKDKTTAIIINKLISKVSFCISFNPRKLAPVKAGIESKNEILPESTLLNLKNLAAVIVTPARLTPGIKARIWNNPINKIDLIFRFEEIFFSIFL